MKNAAVIIALASLPLTTPAAAQVSSFERARALVDTLIDVQGEPLKQLPVAVRLLEMIGEAEQGHPAPDAAAYLRNMKGSVEPLRDHLMSATLDDAMVNAYELSEATNPEFRALKARQLLDKVAVLEQVKASVDLRTDSLLIAATQDAMTTLRADSSNHVVLGTSALNRAPATDPRPHTADLRVSYSESPAPAQLSASQSAVDRVKRGVRTIATVLLCVLALIVVGNVFLFVLGPGKLILSGLMGLQIMLLERLLPRESTVKKTLIALLDWVRPKPSHQAEAAYNEQGESLEHA